MKTFVVVLLVVFFSSISLAHIGHYNKFDKIEMEILRNDEVIGYNNYYFKRDGEKTIVKNQNLVFKILGFSKKQIIFSSLIEFIIIFKSVILIATFFAVIGSKFIMENIFELVWMFEFKVLIYLGFSIGFVTLILILLTNLKYLNPKVYPLIRNQ